jgi:hypothetical protein
MKRLHAQSAIHRAFKLAPLAAALALTSTGALAVSQTYTLDGDFDLGTMSGVNHTIVSNQLQLNVGGSSFPVLWIANAGEDTLSKVDTSQQGGSAGREIARYRTWFNSGAYAHDAWNGAAPSRTAVDVQGNAYVADRGFQSAGYPGWAYIFKILNNTSGMANTSFDGRNGQPVDGTINVNEMMPLVDSNANGIIEPGEIQDQAIAWAVRVPDGVYTGGGASPIPPRQNALARALCIGTDGNLWVGMYNGYEYWKISATDGHTIAGPVTTSYPNYGCLIDGDGNLWGANWSYGVLTKISGTASNTGPYPVNYISNLPAVYGLALRRDASNHIHVIMGGSCNSYVDYDAVTGTISYPAAVNYCSYAVGTDNNGNILVSKRDGGVVKFAPDGSVLWDKGSQVGTSDSRGVIADANNDIWQVHRATHNIAKYKGSDGSFLGVLPVGYEPYTYSDASGTAALSVTTHTGTWNVVKDGGAAGTPWGKVSFPTTPTIPAGASVAIEVRTAETQAGLASQTFQAVTAGTSFSKTGRFIEVKVTLTANTQNQSPIVYDVTVASTPVAVCDVDGDGDIDTIDLGLISRARGQTPTANDPRDANRDGRIDPADVKVCTQRCTRTNCATQ